MYGHSLLQGVPPHPGIEPGSPALQADSSLSEPPGKPSVSNRGDTKLFFYVRDIG